MDITQLFNNLAPQVEVLLKPIGGHKLYHLEGNAWDHTLLVISEMGSDPLYKLIGLLHDIGKSQFYQIDEEGWFTYPNHARGGANMLSNFIPKECPLFETIYWVIANHIKIIHLFNKKNPNFEIQKLDKTIPSIVDKKLAWQLLISLGIADLKGSISTVSDSKQATIEKLQELLARFKD